MQARLRYIHAATLVSFAVFCLLAATLVFVNAIPEQKKLAELEAQLDAVKDSEQKILAEKEYRDNELRSLREDREYLELRARDRLDLYRAGEKVLRIRRQ